MPRSCSAASGGPMAPVTSSSVAPTSEVTVGGWAPRSPVEPGVISIVSRMALSSSLWPLIAATCSAEILAKSVGASMVNPALTRARASARRPSAHAWLG